MEQLDILKHLKVAAREVVAEKNKTHKIRVLRRCLIAVADILDVYLDFQRDRKYGW